MSRNRLKTLDWTDIKINDTIQRIQITKTTITDRIQTKNIEC